MNDSRVEVSRNTEQARPTANAPAWWLVFIRELHDLWIGGKAPLLLVAFCVIQGALTYTMASDPADPTPPKEMVYFLLENAIAVGLFIGVIIGADTISGERERLTLEALLLTPTGRTQILAGKFLGAASVWPAAMVITVPFMAVLAEGDGVLGAALVWGCIMGTLMVPAFTAMAMIVSSWSNSNKSSTFVSLVLYFVFLIPTLLPSGAQAAQMGRLFKRVNPMESNGHFLEKILVNNRTPGEFWDWLASPVIFAVVVYTILFLIASPRLALEARRGGGTRPRWPRRTDS